MARHSSRRSPMRLRSASISVMLELRTAASAS